VYGQTEKHLRQRCPTGLWALLFGNIESIEKSMKNILADIRISSCWVSFPFMVVSILTVGRCGKKEDPKPGPPVQPKELGVAKVWITSGDQSNLLVQQNNISITATKNDATITVDTTLVFQEIEGFGAALTGSSAYLINKRMSSPQRSALAKDLFDPAQGIGISYLRMTIGASDFSLSDYTYDDMPAGQTDYALSNFSIVKDQEDVVPILKQIIAIAPDIKIMGSPWSAPAWMKSNGNLKGGKLKADAYSSYAQYFLKYITAYQKEGIPIDAVTPQNEPLYSTAGYPCMDMPATDQLIFIKDHLGPAFQNAGIKSKIIIYDHNWDNTSYAISILSDALAANYISGSAFHAYAGDVSAMSVVHNARPDKGLYFTEISGGAWATNFSDNLLWNMKNIFIGTTKNWSKVALLWNLALDENSGPKNGGCQDCRGVVTINSSSGAVTKNVEYYSIAHFSKFVKPGAKRVSSTVNVNFSSIDQVAFMNPDGTKVLIVMNGASDAQTLTVNFYQRQFTYSLPGKSVATITWL
jgi:glucosylceramidase